MTTHHDLRARQGETWSFVYTHKIGGVAVDLTNFTARMAIKASYADAASAYLSTGSDANGGTIALGGVAGTVALSMTAAQSDALDNSLVIPVSEDEASLIFRYDLELVSPAGVVTRALEGRFTLMRSVTAS